MKRKIIKNIMLFFVLCLGVATIIIPKQLSNLDELWNFNFAKNISDGKLPYRDFNIVQTPLLSIICGFILKYTAKELLIARVLGVLLNASILFIVYKIFKQLKLNKYYIYTVLIIIYTLFYNYFALDYNFMNLFIILLVLYIEIKSLNKKQTLLTSNFKYNFFLGILVGLSILFKQTTGLSLSVIFMLYIFLFYKKEDSKKILKIMLQRALGIIMPTTIFFMFLLANNILDDFLNYAVYGIKTFTNKIPYYSLIKYYEVPVKVLSIVLPLIMIYVYFKNIVKKEKTLQDLNITIMFVYSVASFIVVFPISDSIHFLIATLPMLILMFYIIYLFGKNKFSSKKNFIFEYLKNGSIAVIIVMLLFSIANIISYLEVCGNYQELNHFKFIPANTESIQEISNFVLKEKNKGKNVYILDASAAVYMIPIDIYNKDYDMFLKGNLGAEGEKGQIEKLKNEANSTVLIMNEKYPRNWQTPETVREYILKNWEKLGELNQFDIYKQK